MDSDVTNLNGLNNRCYFMTKLTKAQMRLTDDIETNSSVIAASSKALKQVNDNAVHKTGNEIINGEKTFNDEIYVNKTLAENNGFPINIINSELSISGNAPSSDYSTTLRFCDMNTLAIGGIRFKYFTNKTSNTSLRVQVYNGSNYLNEYIGLFITTSNVRVFRGDSDNQIELGTASHRWRHIYAGTTTISTSDERCKENIEDIPKAVFRAWSKVQFKQFQFKDAIEEKGSDKARIHIGVIAQQIKTAFESEELDPFEYGLLCYDEWDAQEEQKDENGNVVEPARPAGNRYSVRYEECLALECAYQRYRLEQIEKKLGL